MFVYFMKDLIIRKFKVNFWDNFDEEILASLLLNDCKCKIHNKHKLISKATDKENCLKILMDFRESLGDVDTCLKIYNITDNVLDFNHYYIQFKNPKDKKSNIQNLFQNIRFKFKINNDFLIKSI